MHQKSEIGDQSTREGDDVAIVILTFNQRVKTLECLASLLASEDKTPPIVLWDNGSTDDTAAAVRQDFPTVIVHEHPVNIGVAAGRDDAAEVAIKHLAPEYLLFLDNDLVIEPGFVAALRRPFDQVAKLGQTQAKLRFCHDRQRLNDAGGCRISFVWGSTVPVGYGELDKGQYDVPKDCVACGGAMMVRRDVFEELGGFDRRFGLCGPEDIDFSLRLIKAGYRALYIPAAVAYHEAQHTYGKDYDPDYARLKARNWVRLMCRHASLIQIVGFCLLGLPYRAVRLGFREVRRGNLRALRGAIRGIIEHQSSLKP